MVTVTEQSAAPLVRGCTAPLRWRDCGGPRYGRLRRRKCGAWRPVFRLVRASFGSRRPRDCGGACSIVRTCVRWSTRRPGWCQYTTAVATLALSSRSQSCSALLSGERFAGCYRRCGGVQVDPKTSTCVGHRRPSACGALRRHRAVADRREFAAGDYLLATRS